MAETVPIYVLTSPEVQAFLADNGTSLGELLRAEGVPVEERTGPNPVHSEDGAKKEPVTILLASAAVIATITPLIKSILQRYSKPNVENQVLLPVMDRSGAVVRDKDGQALTHWGQQPLPESKVEVQGPMGIKISFQG